MVAGLSRLPVVAIPSCLKQQDHHRSHAVGDKYVSAVANGTGALPVLLPALGDHYDADDLAERFDGILFTGSPSNVEPHRYGGEPSLPGTLHDADRDATTLPLLRAAIARGVPILCICRGIQELNVALGGSLHQLVHEVTGKRDHRSDKTLTPDERYRAAHPIALPPGGYLRALNGGAGEADVNSLHAQGIDRLAPGLIVEATAPDGLIEAVRVEAAQSFALGVQWHPEHPKAMEWALSRAIFDEFARAVRQRAERRTRPASTPALTNAA
jgi:putative glutamine amidotransferase